jgi:hypothetical protein
MFILDRLMDSAKLVNFRFWLFSFDGRTDDCGDDDDGIGTVVVVVDSPDPSKEEAGEGESGSSSIESQIIIRKTFANSIHRTTNVRRLYLQTFIL